MIDQVELQLQVCDCVIRVEAHRFFPSGSCASCNASGEEGCSFKKTVRGAK